MSKRRWLGLAAAGAGAAAAAATAGVVVERRVVSDAPRRCAPAPTSSAACAASRVTVLTDDGVTLHAEVDEVAPYSEEAAKTRRRPGRRAAPAVQADPTIVFVHGYALNLDCWHFQRAYFRGKHRMVFFDQRSHGRSGRSDKAHATIDQLGDDLRAGDRRAGPRGAGRAGRALDGRHGDHGVRRAAPRAVRRAGRRRRR